MKTVAYPHQKEMVKFALENGSVFFLADPGTGKSWAALSVIEKLKHKALIVCPASLIINWGYEIEKHTELSYTLVAGTRQQKILSMESDTKIYVISYDSVSDYKDFIKKIGIQVLVMDEVHFIKTPGAKRTFALVNIGKAIKYKIGMSGTLISNSYRDMYAPSKVVNPLLFGTSHKAFEDKYCILNRWNAVIGYRNKEELSQKLKSISIAYTLEDVAKSLPPEVEIIKTYQVSPVIKKHIKKFKEEFAIEIEGNTLTASNTLVRALRLQQLYSGLVKTEEDTYIYIDDTKINLLFDLIGDIKGKVIIWCKFVESIRRIMERAKKAKFSAVSYYGEHKADYLDYNKNNCKLWVGQIQTGIGYSLPSAKYSIFYETDYSRVNHIQAKGRNRRISGSEVGNCFYIYLQGQGSLEKVIFNTLKTKDFTANEIIDFIRSKE